MSLSSTVPNSSNTGDDYQQFLSYDHQQQNPHISSSSGSTSSTSLNNNNNNDTILTKCFIKFNNYNQLSQINNINYKLFIIQQCHHHWLNHQNQVYLQVQKLAAYLWLEDLKNYFLAAGVYGNHRTVFAVAHLKEEALLWKTSISELTNPQSVDFDTFGELFLKRFQPISSNLEAREQLRRLKYNGNIQQYVSSFQSLMQKITDMTNTDKLDYFSNGLNRSLKLELIKQNVTDLQQAINIAVRISSIDNHITYNNIINNNNNNTPLSSSTSTSSDNMQIENVLNNIESNGDGDNNTDMGPHMNDGHELNIMVTGIDLVIIITGEMVLISDIIIVAVTTVLVIEIITTIIIIIIIVILNAIIVVNLVMFKINVENWHSIIQAEMVLKIIIIIMVIIIMIIIMMIMRMILIITVVSYKKRQKHEKNKKIKNSKC